MFLVRKHVPRWTKEFAQNRTGTRDAQRFGRAETSQDSTIPCVRGNVSSRYKILNMNAADENTTKNTLNKKAQVSCSEGGCTGASYLHKRIVWRECCRRRVNLPIGRKESNTYKLQVFFQERPAAENLILATLLSALFIIR